ncbi:hypothetical protein OIU76_009013 [Salix suchowensis]|uniref:Uncharacterized protein n=1 Tax=Salix suchowensis TaxID=1278906 RepID=A0ABQ9BEJ8_9ROSI|nr:hypothetical protein OIU76_009013 [Salix suchowensis]KAJ6382674.1 hypothetical protein OIU77_031164 [Salix suchowensis]
MGLSFSLLLSAWSAILGHKFFGSKDTVEDTVVRSLSFGRRDGEMGPRTNSFKTDDSETTGKLDGSDKMSLERSLSFENWESNETKAKPSDPSKNSNSRKCKANEIIHLTKPTISLPEPPVIFFSPRPKCSIDDENDSFKVVDDTSKVEGIEEVFPAITSTDTKADDVDVPIDNTAAITQQDSTEEVNADKLQAPVFDLSRRLSCKWTSGYGPRIGCVRDYPADLQCRALEQVNLSPRTTPGRAGNRFPIPSPRPSPKVRVSPRLAYMGLPSPRVSVN